MRSCSSPGDSRVQCRITGSSRLTDAFPSQLFVQVSVVVFFFFMIFSYWPDVLQNTDEEGGVCHQVTIAGSPSKLLQHYFTSPVIKAQRQKVRVRNGVRLSDGRLSRFDDIH